MIINIQYVWWSHLEVFYLEKKIKFLGQKRYELGREKNLWILN